MEVKKIGGTSIGKVDTAALLKEQKEKEKRQVEIATLYGHLRKMRKQLKRNIKRAFRMDDPNQKLDYRPYLAKYFVRLDQTEQRLIELDCEVGKTIRDYPELLEMIITKFGPNGEELKHESI